MVYIHKLEKNDVKTNGSLPSIQDSFGIVPIGIASPSIPQAWPSTSQFVSEAAQRIPLVQSNMIQSGEFICPSPGFHMGDPTGQPFDQASLTGRLQTQPTEQPIDHTSFQVEPLVQILESEQHTNGRLPSTLGKAQPSISQAWSSTSQGVSDAAQRMPLVQSNMIQPGEFICPSPGFYMGDPMVQPLAVLQPFDQAALTGRLQTQPTEQPLNQISVQVEPLIQILKSEQHMCDQCGETFIYKINLIRHVKTHFEEKEFSYETSNKNFTQKEHLERHRKIHEKVIPTPLEPAAVPHIIVPNPVATIPAEPGTSKQSSPWNKNKGITCYSDIPERIFFKICKYLSCQEVLSLGSVCWRWYLLSRSPVLWERTDLISLNLPSEKSERLLMKLPSTVRELRIGKCSSSNIKQTLNAPAVYNKLFELFPDLNVLIIENALLAKPGSQFYLHNGYMLNCKVPISDQVLKRYSVMQYHSLVAEANFCALISKLKNIQILSLRRSILALPGNSSFVQIRNTPSMLRILDLTLCPCATDKTIQTFCQLPFLEELYIAGTAITVNGVSIILNEVTRLKVLDLDDTVVASETFEILKLHGKFLVELYLGKTTVKDSDITDLNKETFPVLEKLCLKRTAVSEIGIVKLLFCVASLTHIFLTKSQVKTAWMWDQLAFQREIKYDDYDENEECNHFLNNKFQGKF